MRTVFEVGPLIASIDAARQSSAMPQSAPDGWSIHPSNPASIVLAFQSLAVDDAYRLLAYQFRDGGNGNAVVYALPRHAPIPMPDECPRDEEHWLRPPLPADALPDVGLALIGDGSPQSYLAASIAIRELYEMGAEWHGADWSTHSFVDADPRSEAGSTRSKQRSPDRPTFEGLEWHVPAIDEWKPHVDLTSTEAIVRFVTASAAGGQRIVLHEDRYALGQYVFETNPTRLATGGGGYYF